MKYKKTILLLSLFIISYTYLAHPLIEANAKEGYKDEIIRFHIRANSDKEEDQALKLKIRDEILKEMGEKFESTKSLDESRNIIKNNITEMKAITEKVIKKEGEDYSVAVTLGQDTFPTRKYGNLVLPAGKYETLLITLGEGKGQNWWCIMFPPLCFADITHSVAYNIEEELGVTIDKDQEPPLKLKWKIVDLINKLKE
ncbi:stage II sporulation protein R [Tissierella sp.]|uniref:stage II sporulation protein R n=1 Tax=Tissierella sp. TaxID=41274 RepID=UPI00285FFE5D|nr:stage II sporulation protein R [Tissierella sp.]MDR7857579.1 stage II sporulation protein R [Tissierella sp.]